MPVGSPVAACTICERCTGCDQCMNGANVTTESFTTWPPIEMPAAQGFGHPAIAASLEQSVISRLMICTTSSGEASSIACSWQPVMICPPAFTATAEASEAFNLMPTNVRAFVMMRSPVCGRPRRSPFSFVVNPLGNLPV